MGHFWAAPNNMLFHSDQWHNNRIIALVLLAHCNFEEVTQLWKSTQLKATFTGFMQLNATHTTQHRNLSDRTHFWPTNPYAVHKCERSSEKKRVFHSANYLACLNQTNKESKINNNNLFIKTRFADLDFVRNICDPYDTHATCAFQNLTCTTKCTCMLDLPLSSLV